LTHSRIGLVLLPSFFAPDDQRALVKACLNKGPRLPNTTSLDPHYAIPAEEGLWQCYVRDSEGPIPRKPPKRESIIKRTTVDLLPITPDNFDVERASERRQDVKQLSDPEEGLEAEQSLPVHAVLDKLRWCSIGLAYHVSKFPVCAPG
jgi:hypothetical protein